MLYIFRAVLPLVLLHPPCSGESCMKERNLWSDMDDHQQRAIQPTVRIVTFIQITENFLSFFFFPPAVCFKSVNSWREKNSAENDNGTRMRSVRMCHALFCFNNGLMAAAVEKKKRKPAVPLRVKSEHILFISNLLTTRGKPNTKPNKKLYMQMEKSTLCVCCFSMKNDCANGLNQCHLKGHAQGPHTQSFGHSLGVFKKRKTEQNKQNA